MDIRLTRLGHRLHFSIERVIKVTGVNSNYAPGKHFLMWDFDEAPLALVMLSLMETQEKYKLPEMHLLSTGKPGSYHAYCFKSCTFRQARTILSDTASIDTKYLGLGMIRGFFTLRYTDVPGREFGPIGLLESAVKPDLEPEQANCFVMYTKKEGAHK